MPNGKNKVTVHMDSDDSRRLREFKQKKGLGSSDSNAARKLMQRGLRDYEREQDPSHSWLLNIGLAAAMVAIVATTAHIWGGADWLWAGASIWTAVLFLLSHIVELTRRYGADELPVVRRLARRPTR